MNHIMDAERMALEAQTTRRLTIIARVAAAALTFAWMVLLHLILREDVTHEADVYNQAYAMSTAGLMLVFAIVVAIAAGVFPKRNALRFVAAYAIVMAYGIPQIGEQYAKLAKGLDARRGAPVAQSSPEEERKKTIKTAILWRCQETSEKEGALSDTARAYCTCVADYFVDKVDRQTFLSLEHDQEKMQRMAAAAAASCIFKPIGEEWKPHVPKPKAPVLAKDYRPIKTRLPDAAEILKNRADSLKYEGRYVEAEAAYREALEARPAYPEASYQLACNLALAGKWEEALKELDHAVMLGFSAYPYVRFDSDMAGIAQSPRYQAKLAEIRDRYAFPDIEAGAPVVFKPARRPAGSGRYPLIFLLHGQGDSHERYFDEAEAWAKLGFVAVAVPGSLPVGQGAFMWSEDDVAITHEQLQAIVSSPVVSEVIDREQVFVLGFSQGGIHAFYLGANYSERYAGIVSVSPGGQCSTSKDERQTLETPRKLRLALVSGTEEAEGNRALIPLLDGLAKSAGWSTQVITHPGQHHFPTDWSKQMPNVAAYLLGSKAESLSGGGR